MKLFLLTLLLLVTISINAQTNFNIEGYTFKGVELYKGNQNLDVERLITCLEDMSNISDKEWYIQIDLYRKLVQSSTCGVHKVGNDFYYMYKENEHFYYYKGNKKVYFKYNK